MLVAIYPLFNVFFHIHEFTVVFFVLVVMWDVIPLCSVYLRGFILFPYNSVPDSIDMIFIRGTKPFIDYLFDIFQFFGVRGGIQYCISRGLILSRPQFYFMITIHLFSQCLETFQLYIRLHILTLLTLYRENAL